MNVGENILIDGVLHVQTPRPFSFKHCLDFLDRNPLECLHEVKDGKLRKLLTLAGEPFLLQIDFHGNQLRTQVLNRAWTTVAANEAEDYLTALFDLDRDLEPFYKFFWEDELMGPVVRDFEGLRIIGFPDLFEALCWSVIGQQINLNFAYRLKERLVKAHGQRLKWEGQFYYAFPRAEDIRQIPLKQFQEWQFSQSKASYLLGISEKMVDGQIGSTTLKNLPTEEAVEELIKIKGIGPWSAHYVVMKHLRRSQAYPWQDVGLHNALKALSLSASKPDQEQLHQLGHNWHPWQAYATFYLWHTLVVSRNAS